MLDYVERHAKRIAKAQSAGSQYRSCNANCLYKWARVHNNKEVVDQLSMFLPDSSGNLQALAALVLQSAQQTFPLLVRAIKASPRSIAVPQPIEMIFPVHTFEKDTGDLAKLFNRYGSDKSSVHNYHLLYAPLLASRRRDALRVLEIGIGSNNPDVVSSMSATGSPGASLRAFRDFFQMRRWLVLILTGVYCSKKTAFGRTMWIKPSTSRSTSCARS